MKYIYEAIVIPEGSGYEARFPDLGIVTQGNDMQDVAFMAQDLLENYIVISLQKGVELPEPSFEHECNGDEYRMAIVVECSKDTPQVETMTVNEAADVLDVTPTRIRAMIRDGILKSKKVGLIHMVDAQSVMDRFNQPVHAGRPKQEKASA